MLNSIITAYEIMAIWKACCTEDNLKTFLEESLKMKELCHPNVMNLLGVCLDAGPTPYIVLPFMENGDLLSYIKKHRESLLVTECDDIDKVSTSNKLHFLVCVCKNTNGGPGGRGALAPPHFEKLTKKIARVITVHIH